MPFSALWSIKFLTHSLLDVLAPPHCIICEQAIHDPLPLLSTSLHFFVCQRCRDAVAPALPSDILLNRMIAHVPPDDIYLSSVTALLSMTAENETPSPMQLIYALKYGGRYKVGYALGKALGVEIERFQRQSPESPAALPRYDAIVPVPLHASRERERGYNQALWIAQGIAEIIQTPVEASWIRRSKPTISQTTLNAEARVANVRDVFAPTRHILTNRVSTPSPISTSVSVSVSVKNASVLVVDDVFTTGSTLNACAHTLLELGARRVDAAVALAA